MTYKEARVYLDHVSKYGSVLGLDTIRELLHELGDPQLDLKFIHITGTNGKGSVLACTSAILSEAGYRTGRYISPTVISYLERIQIDGTWICEDAFARLTDQVKQAIARMEAAGKASPTIFEVETAIAFLYFKEENCDLVVLECGLGGLLDATNIIPAPLCAVFTSIGEDHIGVLGNTIEEIAADKSGIIKPGCIVISAPQEPSVLKILKRKAAECGCRYIQADPDALKILSEDYQGFSFIHDGAVIHSPLAGKYQKDNLAVAMTAAAALDMLGYRISTQALKAGIARTSWPGRFSCLSRQPLFFADGAHNVPAARRLYETITSYFPGRRFRYIMGVFRDKEYTEIARIMAPSAKAVYTVTLPDSVRSLPAGQLADTMRSCCSDGTPVAAFTQITNAVYTALTDSGSEDIILAFGSLSYLGIVMQAVHEYNIYHSSTELKEMRTEQ